jgi:aspartate dehydrogenase
MSGELKVAMVGFGAIGRSLAALIRDELPQVSLIGVAKRSPPSERDRALAHPDTRFVEGAAALSKLAADVVIECAGHQALAAYAPAVLREGREMLIASVGALADRSLEASLRESAAQGRTKLLLSTGAVGAVDLLCAARIGGLHRVSYTGSKPPHAWKGTPAETLANTALAANTRVDVFEGTAREAALRFPQNANVAATVALAGLGFEATHARLVVDPQLQVNQHVVQAEGAFGHFELAIRGNAHGAQPKTSALVAFSLARYLMHRQAVLSFA